MAAILRSSLRVDEPSGRKLPLRGCALRGHASVPPSQPLPLFALPEALWDVRPHAGPRPTRAVPAARGSGADPRLAAGGRWRGEGVLLRVRIEPLRCALAG